MSNTATKEYKLAGYHSHKVLSGLKTRFTVGHRRNVTHGHAKPNHHSREYASYHMMKQRCNNPKTTGYQYYGGRGIVVCDHWLSSFENFLKDMGARPIGMSLDRIDTNGNYEPSNCRWATHKEQMCNTRRKRS